MTDGRREKFAADSAALSIDWRQALPAAVTCGVCSIGNFDGVHLGHASLLRHARQLADDVNAPVVVVTFDPHPLQLLAPDRFKPPLTTIADRADQLRKIGADHVAVLQTTNELLQLEPEVFFQRIVIERFKARGVVEGFNFHFGHDRTGSVQTLRELCRAAGVPLEIVEPFELNGVTVSSSRVRDALLAGDMMTARTLLNRPYQLRGSVGRGAQRGRTIGFPTANLENVTTLVPADGVYAVDVKIGEETFKGAANIGANPTFGENARKIEIHLIGFEGDLYGKSLVALFNKRLRETKRFASTAELVEQMKRDLDAAKRSVT